MIRATTPTHVFSFPNGENDPKVSSFDKILVTYSQDENIVLELTKEDLVLDNTNNTIQHTFTQEETNLFRENQDVDIQIRIKSSGTVLASKIFKMPVTKVLNDEVL